MLRVLGILTQNKAYLLKAINGMLWLNISKSGDILHETSLDKIVIHLLQNTLVHCKAHFTFLGKQLEEKKKLNKL